MLLHRTERAARNLRILRLHNVHIPRAARPVGIQPLLAALGVSGTLRASFAPYNTQDDVYALVHAVDRALEILVD